MSESRKIGELRKIGTRGEIHTFARFEWQISDYFKLRGDVDTCYSSPFFKFSNSLWDLNINPYGVTGFDSWVGLFIARRDSGPVKTLICKLSIKKADGTFETFSVFGDVFDKKDFESGVTRALTRAKLKEKKSELAPWNALTIVAELTDEESGSVDFFLLERLQNVSSNLKDIWKSRKHSDVVLKTEDVEDGVKAHKMILEARSPFFARKINCPDGVIKIEGIKAKVLECVLSYLYTGEVEGMSPQNMFDVYEAAVKYQLPELKMLCKMFMRDNLSVEVICDVVKFADEHKFTKLNKRCRKYFARNACEIVESDQWKRMERERNDLTTSLLKRITMDFTIESE